MPERSRPPSARAGATTTLVTAWAVLVVLTAVSWWLGAGPRATSAAALIDTLVLALAVLKAYVIGRSFMDTGTAPRPVRTGFVAWCLATFVALTATCVLATQV